MTANLQELAPKHISVRVPAKINLSLKVAPLGEDGFHQLATVFHAVSIYDEVTVSMVKPGQEEISVGGKNAEKIPTNKDNLVSKALTEIAKHVNQPIHARIHIDKSITMSDAAVSSKHRNTHVGPDPETMPAKAPASSPALSNLLNSGLRDKAAACKSLTRFFATSFGFP